MTRFASYWEKIFCFLRGLCVRLFLSPKWLPSNQQDSRKLLCIARNNLIPNHPVHQRGLFFHLSFYTDKKMKALGKWYRFFFFLFLQKQALYRFIFPRLFCNYANWLLAIALYFTDMCECGITSLIQPRCQRPYKLISLKYFHRFLFIGQPLLH